MIPYNLDNDNDSAYSSDDEDSGYSSEEED
jgi:hypothetical protein